MIKKNMKVFNFVDLLVIVALISIILFLYNTFFKKEIIINNDKNFVVEFYVDMSPEYVFDYIKEGNKIYHDKDSKYIFLGEVTNIKLDSCYVYMPNKNGEIIKSTKEGYKSALITANVKGTPKNNGFTVEDSKYFVGSNFTSSVGMGKVYTVINKIIGE